MHPEFAWRYLVLLVLMGGVAGGLICALLERIRPETRRRWGCR